MLLCLALQILQCQCRCKAVAKHMQNAECIAECRCRMQIALQSCRSENTRLKSQTACAPEALGQIVNASRIPPRPLAGQRLEATGQQLEAWKAPPESSWRRLGTSKTSSGELLGSSWRLTEPSWRLLENLGGVLGALGAVLEASWEVLGRSWRRMRGVLEDPWVVLEPS